MTLEMSDFTMKVHGMPDERHYTDGVIGDRAFRDESLRALLINHFTYIIQK
jgi:hypothetical protein